MAGRKSDFTLPTNTLDELFSTQEERDDAKLSKIRDIPLELIDDFPDHPFKVRDDEDMIQLVESVKERGVITPATVRQKEDGRYELISGHRRKRACELAGFEALRCEVVDLDRDAATVLMVESNYQRSQILPSEKAFAYKMRLEAMKRQGQRSDLTSSPVGTKFDRSSEAITEETGDSRNQIHRYIRLTNLVPELLDLVDEGKIKMRPAVELSYLDEDSQRAVVDEIDLNQCTPSHDQTIRMRKFFTDGKLTPEVVSAIMSEEKPNQREKIVLRGDKVDAETGKVIPLAGAGFQLYRPDGSLITQTFTYPEVTTIDTFYTNSDGYLITPEKLEYGAGYSLVEVSAPYGYTLNSEPVYFDVTADNAMEENAVTVVEVTKLNTAQKGVIRISKSGEAFSSVTEADGIYQPVFAVKGLAGAIYEITAAEDIITPDGTLRYTAGEVVDTMTTDETGLAESKPLYLGKYEVREITAPTGYVLNTEVHTAELVYAGQEVEITETAADFCNERQKAAVSLNKVLEQDERFGIGMGGELSAVTFGLFAAEELTAADGSIIPADSLLEIVSVDENGHTVCKTDLPFGSYYLKELSTDEHYILSDEKYPIVFEYAGQDTALVDIKANGGAPIENKLLYGEIHGLKKDEDGSGLAGALIGLPRPATRWATPPTPALPAATATLRTMWTLSAMTARQRPSRRR